MRRFGLIGQSLQHSFSPKYFDDKFKKLGLHDCRYTLIELENLHSIKNQNWDGYKGLNVTIPYKSEIIDYLDGVDELAKTIQAVNTIKIVDGKWYGSNTDVIGFEQSLLNLTNRKRIHTGLILGNGGATKSIAHILEKHEITFDVISRQTQKNYEWLETQNLGDYQLLINTTPLGMYPNIRQKPKLNYHQILEGQYFFDLIYNPEKTLFLDEAEKRGAIIKNGLEMLAFQAEASWEIWNS